MFAGVYQSAVIAAAFVVFYAADAWLMRRYDVARVAGSGRSWGWVLFSTVAVLVLVAQPILLPGLGFQTDSTWGVVLQGLGVLLLAGGLGLHGWARIHLAQFYSERLEVQPGHELVEDGPYAYVRHPVYASFYLCSVGLLLVNPAWTTLLLALYFLWDFDRTARQEEALLSKTLAGYRDYVARTPRYLPHLAQVLGAERRSHRGAGSDRARA
jgi:protein-S-isoprenylcysteine O-methyltransferase Ste14